jgi:hypothetical protein
MSEWAKWVAVLWELIQLIAAALGITMFVVVLLLAPSCCKIKHIGVASDPPVFEAKLPGADIIVRPLTIDFQCDDEDGEAADTPAAP